MIIVLIIVLMILLHVSITSYAKVRKCNSISCKHNIHKKCMLKEIDVYDNKALGICLWHTEDMDKRLLEPFRNGEAIGEKTGEIKLIDKLTKNLEDNRAVKDPKEFEKWMRDHGMDKKG